MEVDMHSDDLIALLKFMKSAPDKFAAAQGMWVNRAAIKTRENILDYMHKHMIIRSPSFLKSRIKYRKAQRGRASVNRVAIVGSTKANRHTGWAEQEGLAEDKREKVLTLASRGGNRQKRVKPSLRMKPGISRPKPTDYPGRTKRQRANSMLQIIGRTRSRKPFILFGHRKLPAGLWRFGAGPKGARDLEPIQLFDSKPAKPKKLPWMTASVDKYFRTLNRKKVWAEIIRRAKAVKK
jgi:hypothetical protein